MKNFKRFTAAIAATLMAASLSVPMASSAGTITIGDPTTGYTGDNANHTYDAYQIFDGDLSTSNSNNVLSNIVWGTGIKSSETDIANLMRDIKAISFTDNDNVMKVPFESCANAADVAEVLAKEINDSDVTKKFADVVAGYLSEEVNAKTTISSSDTDPATVDDGYYLIQDASNSPSTTNASKTRYILRVAGAATINAKSDYPTVMKKVQEESLKGGDAETASFAGDANYELGDGYNDIADYNIGDAVPFKLYGTLPSNYDDYKQYYYCFNDKFSVPQFNAPTSVKVCIDGKEVTQGYTFRASGDNGTMTIEFADLKAKTGNNVVKVMGETGEVDATINSSSVITVEYTAVLSNRADLGAPGQVNGVNLTYSNNPNQESGGTTEPDKSTTTDDGVIVFTYGIDIHKYANNVSYLPGAKFAIYKKDADGNNIYLSWVNNRLTESTARPSDTLIANTDLTDASKGIWVSNDGNDISINGFDAGEYYIEELAAPAGYNKIAGDIKVVVSPTYMTERQAWTYSATGQAANATDNAKALISLEIGDATATNKTVNANEGRGVVNIENKSGSTLPSTGGMGTKLFFLGGGSMVAVAGIFLITKKRMGKNAE